VSYNSINFPGKNYPFFELQGNISLVQFEENCKILPPQEPLNPSNFSLVSWEKALEKGCSFFSQVIPAIETLYAPQAIMFYSPCPTVFIDWYCVIAAPYGSSLENDSFSYLVLVPRRAYDELQDFAFEVFLTSGSFFPHL